MSTAASPPHNKNATPKRAARLCPSRRDIGFTLLGICLSHLSLPRGAQAREWEPTLLAALRDGGHLALMRHASAPGVGDPPGFRLGDCATQRGLSDVGRSQARQTGARLRSAGIVRARLYSSRWCRCLETAQLLDLGPVEPLPNLDSFFGTTGRGPAQTKALHNWIGQQPTFGDPLVLVTHQVNITALTGQTVDSGEILVMRRSLDGPLATIGRLAPVR